MKLLLLSLFSSLLLCSCGKEATIAGGEITNIDPVVDTQLIEQYLSRQSYRCTEEDNCPESLGRVIIYDSTNDEINNCSGFLISSEYLVTSSGCLTQELLEKKVSCQGRIFTMFAEQSQVQAETVGCSELVFKTNVHSTDPEIVKNALAIIRIDKKISRRFLIPSDQKLKHGDLFEMWAVKFTKPNEAIGFKQNCTHIKGSYAHPLSALSQKNPNILLSGCHVEDSMRGGIWGDQVGRVFGMLHSELPAYVVNYLRYKELLETGNVNALSFATNLGCFQQLLSRPTSADSIECPVDWSLAKLEDARKAHRTGQEIHSESFNQIRQDFQMNEETNFFVRWKVEFSPRSNNSYNTSFKEECFNNMDTWLPDMTFRSKYKTDVKFKYDHVILRFNPNLLPKSIILPSQLITREIEFSVKELRRHSQSYLKIEGIEVPEKLLPCID